MASSGESFDVIVVGAGLSGLTAARTVLRKKPTARVLVVEAKDQIGGEISYKELKSASGTNEWDLSGSRIGTSQKEILQLLKEVGLETFPQYNKGNKFWRLPDGKVKKFSGAIPPLPYATLLDVVRYFKKVDGMQGQIAMERVHECKHAEEWDGLTVEEFLKKYLWTQIGRITIETMTKSFCCAYPSELSMMQYLYIIHTCGGWDLHINSGDKGRSDLRIKGGVMSLCRKLAKEIGEENIVLGDMITKITEQENDIQVSTASGKEYHTQRVIVAASCCLSGKITYDPPLRVNRGNTFPRKCDLLGSVITYKSPFWREAGHAGEYLNMAATTSISQSSTDETLVIAFDNTLPSGEAALKLFAKPEKLKGKSKEERKDTLLRMLSEVFGRQALDCIDYADEEWLYDAVGDEDRTPVSRSSELLACVTKPHGRVHWAGSDSGTAWHGLLNSAVQSGQRAAEEVIAAL